MAVGSLVSTSTSPRCVTWSPDGRFIAVANNGTTNFQIFRFNGSSTPTQVGGNVTTGTTPRAIDWSPDGKFIAVANYGSATLQVFKVNYFVTNPPTADTQAPSTSIVFGDRAKGTSYDADVTVLPGAQINVDGKILYDGVS